MAKGAMRVFIAVFSKALQETVKLSGACTARGSTAPKL